MDHDVAGKPWVATALPRATDVAISFKNLDVGVTRLTELIGGDDVSWEQFPLEALAEKEELLAYKHDGFWQSMDTLRDKVVLDSYWSENQPPWTVW
jgi:NDP-sugar pyrophosphorylase family protein